MPSSSEAVVGRYNPKYVPDQNYNREPKDEPKPESVKVNVDELNEIPSATIPASNTKKLWIFGGLAILGALGICAGVTTPLLLTQFPSTTSTAETSSTTSSANNASGTTTGSSNSSSTTLSTSSVSSGSNSSSTSVSTSSVSSATTVAAGFSAGGAVLSSTTAYYGYEEVTVTCTTNLNNMTITITVQRTVNATYSGAFSTFWGGTVNQASSTTASQLIYTWTIVSGQTIQASGSPYRAQAQFSLFGTNQVTSADTYTVVASTTGGVTSTFSGHF